MKAYRLVLTYTLNPDGTRKHKIDRVAFVGSPAIEETWLALKDEPLKVKFEAVSEEKQIVMGPLMVADKPILRIDPKTKEPFIVTVDAENIEAILLDMAKNGYNNNINSEHTTTELEGICMYQAWIINRELGINPPKAWPDLVDGSAMGVWKVENEVAWSKVKDGTYTGPSIEGFLKL